MIAFIVAFLVVGLVIGVMVKSQKDKERHAEAVFKQTMIALELKAKQEGTFRQSYFGTENDNVSKDK